MTFGIDRFQEWRQMITNNMSYIAIDLNIDITTITKKMFRVIVVPYNLIQRYAVQLQYTLQYAGHQEWLHDPLG